MTTLTRHLLPRTNDRGVVLTETKHYAEVNKSGAPNTDAVATYAATDPEGLQTIRLGREGRGRLLRFTINSRARTQLRQPARTTRTIETAAGVNTATPGALGIAADGTGDGNGIYSVLLRADCRQGSPETPGPAQAASFFVNVDRDQRGRGRGQ